MKIAPTTLTYTNANKAAWDASAHLHEQGSAWDELVLAAGKPGFNELDACLTATLNSLGVVGRTAVQVGCNNARELLSLSALGAIPLLGACAVEGIEAKRAKTEDRAVIPISPG